MPRHSPRGPSATPPEVLARRPEFARQMVTRRVALGLTQEALANLAKVPYSSVAAYEVGVVRPGPISKAKIMRALAWEE